MAAITLIGSGKAATVLGKALKASGHKILQVWSRSEANAQELATILHSAPVSDLSAINDHADVYVISVKDDSIEEVAGKLHVGNKIVAHTSGIKSKEQLRAASENYGVFYPFVSMTKETSVDFRKALMMVEGSNESTLLTLYELAKTLSDNVKQVDEQQRQTLHLAAVFANNFTNHMYAIAEQILEEKGLSFDDLRPLIASHLENILSHPPSTLQTGPAVRGDQSTIDIHKALLDGNEELKKVYSLLTSSIQDFQKKK
jgi:predicted short-subunit dehydrogenase-like oxidoreductase (DUF2520 family)